MEDKNVFFRKGKFMNGLFIFFFLTRAEKIISQNKRALSGLVMNIFAFFKNTEKMTRCT